MNTHFSENRMLAQRAPEGRRAEAPGTNEFRDVVSRLEKGASELVRNAMSPENRAQFNRVVETFNKEISQITNQLMTDIRRELPKLGEYIRMGGRAATESGRFSWDGGRGVLANLLGRNGGPRREFTLPVAADETASVSFQDDDGTVDMIDIHGDGEETFEQPGFTTYVIDEAGMQRILGEARADNQRQSTERTRVLTDSAAKLEALRARIGTPATPAPRTETPATATRPATTDTGRTNLQPLPGETREQQRARLEKSLEVAKKAFDDQKAVVDRLVAAGSATPADQLKTERQKLIKLEQEMLGIEGQITALRGERVSDTEQR
ncbi:MAG TPA: hypothetical protein PKV72_01295 [Candidatus Peribacteria bacterium]|nr:hypothetical protein [Candidatus Peribacteria bacterium]